MAAPDKQHEPIGLPMQAAPSMVASHGAVSACGGGDFATRRTEIPGVVQPGSLGGNDSLEREESLEYWLFCGDGSGMRER
jgi:hypothetical protein